MVLFAPPTSKRTVGCITNVRDGGRVRHHAASGASRSTLKNDVQPLRQNQALNVAVAFSWTGIERKARKTKLPVSA